MSFYAAIQFLKPEPLFGNTNKAIAKINIMIVVSVTREPGLS